MINANMRETRNIVGNFTTEEMVEAVKAIPSEILEDELSARSALDRKKLNAIDEVMRASR